MPRKARIDIPGLLQHVIVRGIERRSIFLDNFDRKMFIDRFATLLEETETDCFAWALLNNHFHLLLRCNQIELSRFMRRLLTGYAVNFNHRHHRSGHLFQNRYKSIICEEDAYLLELIRYIHLNPLRAKIISDLESLDVYSWCGHSVLLGKGGLPGQVVDEVLILFGEKLSNARIHYRQFVADGITLGQRPELVGGGLRRSQNSPGRHENIENFDDRVLGSGAFVESLQQDVRLTAILPPRLSLPEIRKIVCQLFEVDPDAIFRRTRTSSLSQARALFCHIAVRLTGVKGTEIARYLSIGASGVSRLVKRGEQILRDSPALEQKLKDILNH